MPGVRAKKNLEFQFYLGIGTSCSQILLVLGKSYMLFASLTTVCIFCCGGSVAKWLGRQT